MKTFYTYMYTRANRPKRKEGFALFYAVLITSLVLAIGLATADISFKQGRLIAGALDSQAAFYAADTGLECVLYWDIQQDSFNGIAPKPIVTCNGGEEITAEEVRSDVWTISLTDTGGLQCAEVTIDKSSEQTIIDSRGYNTCDTANGRRVERGIRATY